MKHAANNRLSPAHLELLNRMLAMVRYSLPSYLRYARPWTRSEEGTLVKAVQRTIANHEAHARRVGRFISSLGGRIASGQFPLEFTGYNDLALNYLAPRVVEHQQQLVDDIARCGIGLSGNALAREMAEDILAAESQNLQQLIKALPLSARQMRRRFTPSLAA